MLKSMVFEKSSIVALLVSLGWVAAAQAQGQSSVLAQTYGYSSANRQTTITDLITGTTLYDQFGTDYFDSVNQYQQGYSSLGNPASVSMVTTTPINQGFRQLRDAVGVTSATWTATAEAAYGVNRAGVSISGAVPAPMAYSVADPVQGIQIDFSATANRYIVAHSQWQDLFVMTPSDPALLGTPTTASFTVALDGSFTQGTGYFHYSLRNFDNSQIFYDASWNYSGGASPGDLVTFGPTANTYTFNLSFGQPFLITAGLYTQIYGVDEGSVDLMNTARITSINIPTNAAITFLSGAPAGAFGGVSGGVYGQYGGGGGGLSPIPEPETRALMLAGLGLCGLMAWRRRRQ